MSSTRTMIRLDFWYEFASTYSYPAAMLIDQVAETHGVEVRWRPFLLGPIFADQGWRNSPFNIYPAKGRYMWRDLERICEKQNLPFSRPNPFPQNSLLAARVATALEGDDRARFSRAVYAAEYGEGRSIDDRALIAGLLKSAGLTTDALERASSDPVKTALKASVEEARRMGIFGAPAFVAMDNELFWGFDRLEAALDWAVERT
jgi:2-hydroxychromene-2-carboxylate isomerase